MRILCVGTNQEEFQLLELVLSKEVPQLEFADLISIWDPFTFGQQMEGGFDVVLLQQEFEWRDRALAFLRKQWPKVPIVVLAEPGQESAAVATIKAGASDFLIRSSKTYLELPALLRRLEAQSEEPAGGRTLSDERILALIDRAGIGWFQARLDGEIVEANAALRRLLGVDRVDELSGCGIPVMGPRPLGAFNERGELSRQMVELEKPGGGTVPALVTELILLDADGAMVIDGLVEDTTAWEERGSGEEGRRSERETSEQQFATMVAHELRRPL
ncbi:MAG: hypothetical protein R3325_15635, partial [Thermoanaerobaculia bacterium]|nr:hypothetical protein [Thermoanaerobaculia bacterium]